MADSISISESTSEQTAAATPSIFQLQDAKVVLFLVALAVTVFLLKYMQPVLLPLALGTVLFYALDPAVDWLQTWRVPRVIGAAVMLVGAIGGCAVLAFALRGQALTVIDQLPEGARKLAQTLESRPGAEPGAIEKVQEAADALKGHDADAAPAGVTRVQIEDQSFRASTLVWSGSIGLMGAVNQLVVVVFLTYFMLLSDQLFKRKLVELVGTLSKKKITVGILEDIATQIERFLYVQIMTSGLVAVATGLALWAMGLHQAALWGLLAGIFNIIPNYGPLLVTAGLATVGFLQFGTLGPTISVALVSLVITTLEGSILTPMWLGKTASMNRVAVFAGLLFWSWEWGVWGMLLAVPMMMVIKVICDNYEPLHPVAHLLSE